jgi:hypothetical protein
MAELIEILADAEHASWARWMVYLFSKSNENADGSVTIPSPLAARWQRQAATPYAALSEPEQESDREEVRAALAALDRAGYTVWPPVDVVAVAAVREVVVARGELAIKAAEAVVIPSDEARAIVRHCLDQLNRWQFVPLDQGGQAP